MSDSRVNALVRIRTQNPEGLLKLFNDASNFLNGYSCRMVYRNCYSDSIDIGLNTIMQSYFNTLMWDGKWDNKEVTTNNSTRFGSYYCAIPDVGEIFKIVERIGHNRFRDDIENGKIAWFNSGESSRNAGNVVNEMNEPMVILLNVSKSGYVKDSTMEHLSNEVGNFFGTQPNNCSAYRNGVIVSVPLTGYGEKHSYLLRKYNTVCSTMENFIEVSSTPVFSRNYLETLSNRLETLDSKLNYKHHQKLISALITTRDREYEDRRIISSSRR